MKHFYIEIPPSSRLVSGGSVTIHECADADELDLPDRVYLGSTDDDGNPTTALAGAEGMSASLSAIRGPFFKAAVRDGMQGDAAVPCVVNADHVALCLKDEDGTADLILDSGLRFDLDDPYDTIADELFGVMDVSED